MKEAFYIQLSPESFDKVMPGMVLHHTGSGVKLLVVYEYMPPQANESAVARILKVLDDNGNTAICGVEVNDSSPWELL